MMKQGGERELKITGRDMTGNARRAIRENQAMEGLCRSRQGVCTG